ncbi:MAG TPA: fumarylacetoacetate hydrolase family protein [Casimicrobiaceae bacterium]|nr:fumarylacetoacetate hydrolase family protein [Casimicrobiaceae bacterium]
MPDETASARIARLLIRARREHRQVELGALGVELATAEDAYRAQDEIARALGFFANERPSAWKVGASKPGATPIAVPLPPRGIVASPAQFEARTFHSIRIEAEIAFRFGAGIATARDHDDWRRWIDALVVTIEVVDTRIADSDRASALAKLADAQQHGALVIGTSIPRRDLDWKRLRAIVRRNADVVADTRGGHPLGDPSALLPWFVRHVAARGYDVRAGDLVTAGTWASIVPASPGDTVDVEFPEIGSASARFD